MGSMGRSATNETVSAPTMRAAGGKEDKGFAGFPGCESAKVQPGLTLTTTAILWDFEGNRAIYPPTSSFSVFLFLPTSSTIGLVHGVNLAGDQKPAGRVHVPGRREAAGDAAGLAAGRGVAGLP